MGKRLKGSPSFSERFWAKVDKREPDECWLWIAAVTRDGYGRIGSADGNAKKTLSAHRVAYELTFGKVQKRSDPYDTCILHQCDNKLCCNPDHLFLGTQKDNITDMIEKGRRKYGNAKLTETQVREIRYSLRSQQSIARQYRVDPSLISLIKSNKIWRHVS